eukprot:TRINITY_DN20544_c0_g1_i2.p2 TRINITY_DN20544_c0_g1~~TRINITY_DN20544_c0_g1_i2.p2  ORF type:complete len:596 (-),score=76.35 TRINITY_DN20544_c0_g1_i2:2604-4391(-)
MCYRQFVDRAQRAFISRFVETSPMHIIPQHQINVPNAFASMQAGLGLPNDRALGSLSSVADDVGNAPTHVNCAEATSVAGSGGEKTGGGPSRQPRSGQAVLALLEGTTRSRIGPCGTLKGCSPMAGGLLGGGPLTGTMFNGPSMVTAHGMFAPQAGGILDASLVTGGMASPVAGVLHSGVGIEPNPMVASMMMGVMGPAPGQVTDASLPIPGMMGGLASSAVSGAAVPASPVAMPALGGMPGSKVSSVPTMGMMPFGAWPAAENSMLASTLMSGSGNGCGNVGSGNVNGCADGAKGTVFVAGGPEPPTAIPTAPNLVPHAPGSDAFQKMMPFCDVSSAVATPIMVAMMSPVTSPVSGAQVGTSALELLQLSSTDPKAATEQLNGIMGPGTCDENFVQAAAMQLTMRQAYMFATNLAKGMGYHSLEHYELHKQALIKASMKGKKGDSKRLTLFVGGLKKDTNDEKLRQHFSQYGEVTRADVIRNVDGTSRGFGFVKFVTEEEIDRCMKAKFDHILDGQWVNVKVSDPNRADAGKNASKAVEIAAMQAGVEPSHYLDYLTRLATMKYGYGSSADGEDPTEHQANGNDTGSSARAKPY